MEKAALIFFVVGMVFLLFWWLSNGILKFLPEGKKWHKIMKIINLIFVAISAISLVAWIICWQCVI